MQLLTVNNTKIRKGEKFGYLTGVLHLAPARLSGYDVCPYRDAGCEKACLNTAGYGRFDSTQRARVVKTKWLFSDRPSFLTALERDIRSLVASAGARGMQAAVRLNCMSDLSWESPAYGCLIQTFPSVTFYDYTKSFNRATKNTLPNYSLTYSRGCDNDNLCKIALGYGVNVAVIFDSRPFPSMWWGCRVIDGDESDLRFLDPKPVIVGLAAKGRGRMDETGFVIRRAEEVAA